jgi:membrane-associated phospholipid phosphatase
MARDGTIAMSNTSLSFPVIANDKLTRVARLLWQSFLVQWPFHLLALAFAFTSWWMSHNIPAYKQAPLNGLALGIITFTFPIGMVSVFVFRLGHYLLVLKPESPTRQMITDILSLVKRPSIWITALPLLMAMVVFNKGMIEMKPMIAVIKPFAYDHALMQLDRTLHFGFDPWVLLHPFFGSDVATLALGIVYDLWFFAMFGVFLWFGFSSNMSQLRTQFFVAYMLTWWIGGGIIATMFSSAGPVYYGDIGLSPDPYAPLFQHLYDVNTRIPIWNLDMQRFLWDSYVSNKDPLGISAFPSMHNGMALLFALVTWRCNRKLGIAFAIFALLILFASVYLGWHYAVDGYGAFVLVLVFWWMGGIFARWHDGLPSTRNLNKCLAEL